MKKCVPTFLLIASVTTVHAQQLTVDEVLKRAEQYAARAYITLQEAQKYLGQQYSALEQKAGHYNHIVYDYLQKQYDHANALLQEDRLRIKTEFKKTLADFTHAAAQGDKDAVIYYLEGLAIDPQLPKIRPLYAATAHNQRRMIELLLSYKADINDPNEGTQERPITAAARAGDLELISYLLQRGAKVMAVDIDCASTDEAKKVLQEAQPKF